MNGFIFPKKRFPFIRLGNGVDYCWILKVLDKRKLIDIGLPGFKEYWKNLLDGYIGHWTVGGCFPRQSTSDTNVHVDKLVDNSSIALFFICSFYSTSR